MWKVIDLNIQWQDKMGSGLDHLRATVVEFEQNKARVNVYHKIVVAFDTDDLLDNKINNYYISIAGMFGDTSTESCRCGQYQRATKRQ